MRLFRYLRWRFTHAHIWSQIASDTWACTAAYDDDKQPPIRCGEWYGEQAWS